VRRVGDGPARLGRDAGDHGLDEGPQREILARAGLGVLGAFFDDAFVDVALRVGIEGRPGDVVHHLDDAGKHGRILDLVLGLGEDLPERSFLSTERAQGFDVVHLEFGALERTHDRPREARGHADLP